MEKALKKIVICMLILSVFGGATEVSAASISSVKKLYKASYEHDKEQLVAEYPNDYPMGMDSFSYAYAKLQGKKYPYFLKKECYNYSICGISVYYYNKGTVSFVKSFSGQEVYYYKKYLFVENFAGGGCGTATMYKLKNGSFKKIKGGSKAIALSDQDQVHKASIKFAKKTAKRLGLKFKKFKKVKWKA